MIVSIKSLNSISAIFSVDLTFRQPVHVKLLRNQFNQKLKLMANTMSMNQLNQKLKLMVHTPKYVIYSKRNSLS